MKPIHFKHCLSVLLLLWVVTSCKKEDLPEATTEGYGKMSYFAKASGSGVKRLYDTSNTVAVEWSSATVYVEKISFVGVSDNKLDTTIMVGKNINIFNADALAGMIQLPTGSYKDVMIKLYCLKSQRSELAFMFKGTFTNTKGGRDSVQVASSYPFDANLEVPDIIINPLDKYNVIFNFNLDKVLAGISTESLQTARSYTFPDNSRMYTIWKGGGDDEPFYNQVIENWQTVASVVITKE